MKTGGISYHSKILFFATLIFFSSMVSADIISINSGGDGQIVIIPNEIIDGFFFGEIPDDGIIGGGSGGRTVKPILEKIDEALCRETFIYIEENGQENFTEINNLILNAKEKTNITYTFEQVKEYIENWQFFCSDKINRTLNEEFVCGKVKEFRIEHETFTVFDIDELNEEMNITISNSLIIHYINNYEPLCEPSKFKIVPKPVTILLWIIIIGMMLIVAHQNNKKKKILTILKSEED